MYMWSVRESEKERGLIIKHSPCNEAENKASHFSPYFVLSREHVECTFSLILIISLIFFFSTQHAALWLLLVLHIMNGDWQIHETSQEFGRKHSNKINEAKYFFN
jgi:hypothetical protein